MPGDLCKSSFEILEEDHILIFIYVDENYWPGQVFFQVTTKDGYILNMQRIPEGRFASGNTIKKQPVLIQHGVLVVSH